MFLDNVLFYADDVHLTLGHSVDQRRDDKRQNQRKNYADDFYDCSVFHANVSFCLWLFWN